MKAASLAANCRKTRLLVSRTGLISLPFEPFPCTFEQVR